MQVNMNPGIYVETYFKSHIIVRESQIVILIKKALKREYPHLIPKVQLDYRQCSNKYEIIAYCCDSTDELTQARQRKTMEPPKKKKKNKK
jgi:hypothetical protein